MTKTSFLEYVAGCATSIVGRLADAFHSSQITIAVPKSPPDAKPRASPLRPTINFLTSYFNFQFIYQLWKILLQHPKL